MKKFNYFGNIANICALVSLISLIVLISIVFYISGTAITAQIRHICNFFAALFSATLIFALVAFFFNKVFNK